MKKYIIIISILLSTHEGFGQIITTIAGNGVQSCFDIMQPATDAGLGGPFSLTIDDNGNLYVANIWCYQIYKINTSGIISLVAGHGPLSYSGDGGPATLAGLNQPTGVAVDHKGNIYIADNLNFRVRKVDTTGIISTFAGTGVSGYNGDTIAATNAKLSEPQNVMVDKEGNIIIADAGRIRKVDSNGIITTIARTDFAFWGLCMDTSGSIYATSMIFVGSPATPRNCYVYKVNTDGTCKIIAGKDTAGYSGDGGPATAAMLNVPFNISSDKKGNLFIADYGNNLIRRIDEAGIITTFAGDGSFGYAGDGGPASICSFTYPAGVAVDSIGNLYIADDGNNRIRYINTKATGLPQSKLQSDFNIYPNPSTGKCSIMVSSSKLESLHITISSMAGQVVYTKTISTNLASEFKIVTPGVYLVTASNTELFDCKKIVVLP